METIEIDGSYLEGGGQILRTALAMSVITGKRCHIFNIRKGRKISGMMRQHLAVVRAIKDLTDSQCLGDTLFSEELLFTPNASFKEIITIDLPTASSVTLMSQSLMLVSLFAKKPTSIHFIGGATDTFFAQPADHFKHVLLSILKNLGVFAEFEIEKRGFYPEGMARCKLYVQPIPEIPSKEESFIFQPDIKPIILTKRGKLEKIKIISGATVNLKKEKTAEKQLQALSKELKKYKDVIEEDINYYFIKTSGSHLSAIARFENSILGYSAIGTPEKDCQQIAKEVAENFKEQIKSKACLDKFAADQIIPFIALSHEKCEFTAQEITNHLKTNIWVVEKFVKGKFEIQQADKKVVWHPPKI